MSSSANIRRLDDYILLGRTGLRVSPLCFGAMTFGDPDGMGVDEATSRELFDCYRDHGGNFIDTANVYAGGNSERILGKFVRDSSVREEAHGEQHKSRAARKDPATYGLTRERVYAAMPNYLAFVRESQGIVW